MASRNHLLVPDSESGWELWSSKRIVEKVADPSSLDNRPIDVGLSVDRCRSFPLILRGKEKRLFRNMVFSQLEKRGMITTGVRFEFEVLSKSPEGSLVRVDLLGLDGATDARVKNPRSYGPSLRYYPMPSNRMVLLKEHGKLVMAANRDGSFIYSQVLNYDGVCDGQGAQDIKMAIFALKGEGFLKTLEGVEVWGDYSTQEVADLKNYLSLPVTQAKKPVPEQGPPLRKGYLTSSGNVEGESKKRKPLLILGVILGLLIAYLAVLNHFASNLRDFQNKAAALSGESGEITVGSKGFDEATERWNAFVSVVQPDRYPLVHLNHVARVMPEGGVILKHFESKISEVKIRGEANSAKAAFELLENIESEPELQRVYKWSMKNPEVKRDNSAEFEVVGKLR